MPEAPDQGVHSVLFLGTDPALWALLRASARELGASLRGCRTLAGIALAASLEPTRVLVLELAALAPGRTPEQVLDRVQAESGSRPLLLCLGEGAEAQQEEGALGLPPPIDGVRLTEALAALLRLPLPERGRVLLLADSPVRDDLYARLLRGAGIRVELVSDLGQVEAVAERLRPQLAILDLDMETAGEGSLDGRVRDCPGCQDLPIIFLCGDLPDSEGVEGRRIGGDDYLTKPVAPEHLLARVRDRLEGAQGPGGSRVVVYRCPGAEVLATGVGDPPAVGTDQAIAALLRRALRGEGFRLLYQPILPLRKRADQRYEVLLRLRTPEGAIIPPMTFLPVARSQGLLPALDRWVLSGALRALRQERDAGHPTRFLIHQTPESLGTPNWLGWVRDEILRLDLIRQRPVLAFNAWGILAHEPKARQLFPELARLGIEVCLTGITDSSQHLRLIRRRGATLVKLTRELASEGTARALKTTVEGLHELGARVIASGIEEPDMIGRVWSSGVDYIQGNLIQFPEETLDFNFGESDLR